MTPPQSKPKQKTPNEDQPPESNQGGGDALSPAPSWARWGVLLGSLVVGVVAAIGAGYAVLGFERPVLGMFGFELVATVAAVLGVLLGLGRFRDGFGLGALCVAGTFVAAALFGLYLDANANISSARGTQILNAAMAVHVGGGVLIAALGGLAVLIRSPRSWGYLVKGVVIASPAVAVAVWVYKTRGAALSVELGSTGSMVRAVAVIVGTLVLMVLFSVGAHLCIRAFEVTRPDDQPA